MEVESCSTWTDLVRAAMETCIALAKNHLRGKSGLSNEALSEFAFEAALRTAPRRDNGLLAVVDARIDILRRPLSEPVNNVAEAINIVATEMLCDELTARLGTLRRDVFEASREPAVPESVLLAPVPRPQPLVWEAFLPQLEDWFVARMRNDAQAGPLPDLRGDPEAAAGYIAGYVDQAMPGELLEILSLVGSAAELAGSPLPRAQSFADCASMLLERELTDRFTTWMSDHEMDEFHRARVR